jgi:hypothetical protein
MQISSIDSLNRNSANNGTPSLLMNTKRCFTYKLVNGGSSDATEVRYRRHGLAANFDVTSPEVWTCVKNALLLPFGTLQCIALVVYYMACTIRVDCETAVKFSSDELIEQ